MDFLINTIAGALNTMSAVLGGWSFPRNLATDVLAITPYLEKANMILPVDELLIVLGLFLGLQLILMAYYWITRMLNLIRGAG